MNAPYNQDVLAAAEACFAQASQLLYCEPDAEVVADQVAERPFQNAPFGMDDADVREGMALMDAWCVAAAADEAGFDESVAALRRETVAARVAAAVRGCRNARCAQLGVVLPRSEQPAVQRAHAGSARAVPSPRVADRAAGCGAR